MNKKEAQQNRSFIEGIQFFQNLTSEQKDKVSGVLIPQKFAKGQAIVNEKDPGSSFYIIKEGVCSVQKEGKEVKRLVKGESFGEMALLSNNGLRQMSIVAAEDT